MRNDILVGSVLQQKTVWYRSKPHKSQLFVKAQRGQIGLYNGIELQNPKPQTSGLVLAVTHQRFADMHAAQPAFYRIARIADVPAPACIIGMKDIQPYHLSATVIVCNAGKRLLREKSVPCLLCQRFDLRKCCAGLDNFIPDGARLPDVRMAVFFDRNLQKTTPS